MGVFWGGSARAAEGPAGAVRGTVRDKDFDAPLAQVRVTIVEALLSTATNSEGAFVFERVPAGTYTLSFSKSGYDRLVLPGIAVSPGQVSDVRAELVAEVVEMDELVVTGTDAQPEGEVGLLEIRAAATSVQDAVSSELISRSGASDVAGALKLVVGTSIVDGKYATVRGLSDRYTGATLNGVRIPSADPRRRAVQMDLFPTGTVESVTVRKTFTPDLQGDFTGGGVDIRTRSVPNEALFTTSVTCEYNTQSTGNEDSLTYLGGGVGTFGMEADRHALPSEATQPLPEFPNFSRHPSAEDTAASQTYDQLVRSFDPTMGVTHLAPGPNFGLSLVGGDKIELGGGAVLGALGAFTWSHKHDFYEGGQNNQAGVPTAGAPVGITKARTDSMGIETLLAGFLGSLVLKPDDQNQISLRLILNQAAEDEARYQEQDTGYPSVEQNQSLQYTERKVGSWQLAGEHRLDAGPFQGRGLQLNWVGAYNFTKQEEPDVRFFRNTYNYKSLFGTMPSNSTDAKNTRRIWRNIEENDLQGALDVTLPFLNGSGTEGSIKAGLFLDHSNRDYTQRSFSYTFAQQFGSIFDPKVNDNRSQSNFQGSRPGQLWTDVFLDPDRIGLAWNQPPAPNQLLWVIVPLGTDVDYTGEQAIDALYAMTDLPLTPRLRLIGGLRYETTDISIVPVNPIRGTVEVINVLPTGDREIVTVPQDEASTKISEGDFLPALGASWEFRPGMFLRGSWSHTIARPTFRELAPVATEEFIFGDEFIGNPDLTLSKITNYDLRWEWFPGSSEVLAASLFYKELTDPIELISFSAGGRTLVQPVNFPKGTVLGAEFEARTSLERLGPSFRGFSVGANYTYIGSEVEVPLSEQESLAAFGLDEPTHRLQGQPAYLLNASVTWDNGRSGTSAGLFFGRIGETLVTGAARGTDDCTPDTYALPYDTLDFKISQQIGGDVTLSFRGANLLRPVRTTMYRTPQGSEAVHTERPTGALFAISALWTW